MSIPASPRHAEWQPGRIPKLNYRNPIPRDQTQRSASPLKNSETQTSDVEPSDSGRSSGAKSTTTTATVIITPAPTKKKNSVFGGFFAKEPTLIALAQVEADLKAKHGAATSQKVPHVSSRKMPDHVPKVNSKWDGVPEAVRMRDKQQKHDRYINNRDSLQSHSFRSRSTEDPTGDDRRSRRQLYRGDSDVASNAESWRSRSQTRIPDRRPRSNSIYTTSSEDSREIYARRAASLRSPSGSSLPEITSFFPHHKKQPVSAVPLRWQSTNSTNTSATKSSDQSRSEESNRENPGLTFDRIPEHDSSLIMTPRETSPVTPNYIGNQPASPEEKILASELADANQPIRWRRVPPVPTDAFLAGEAKPLELTDVAQSSPPASDLPLRRFQHGLVDRVQPDLARRPDSSRDRLGLRSTMVVRTEAAPWETQDSSMAATTSPVSKSKGLLRGVALFR